MLALLAEVCERNGVGEECRVKLMGVTLRRHLRDASHALPIKWLDGKKLKLEVARQLLNEYTDGFKSILKFAGSRCVRRYSYLLQLFSLSPSHDHVLHMASILAADCK